MSGKGKKRKIEIKKKEEGERRFVTFSKRRNGLFKKVEEIALHTGCRIAALVFSPAAIKPHTSGDMSVIDQYISDTCREQPALEVEIGVEAALQMHASLNVEEINDLDVLMGMRNELLLIRNTLVQGLNGSYRLQVDT